MIRRYWDIGVRHIVALRGDPPGGVGTPFMPHPLGYPSSSHLVAASAPSAISRFRSRPIPRAIPKALPSTATSTRSKSKIDAGATRAITQFFFDNDIYLRFLERARATRNHHSDRAGHHADPQFQTGRGLRRQGRRQRAAMARRPFRRAGRRPRNPCADRGDDLPPSR